MPEDKDLVWLLWLVFLAFAVVFLAAAAIGFVIGWLVT